MIEAQWAADGDRPITRADIFALSDFGNGQIFRVDFDQGQISYRIAADDLAVDRRVCPIMSL